jgi:hypothetical protein
MTGLSSITPSRAIPIIAEALADHQSVMLWGPPGCAKSDVARQIAAMHFDEHLIDIRLATTPPEDFHLPVPNMEDRVIDWLPTRRLPNEKRDGKRGILLLDEITSAPPASATLGYQLCLDRKCGDTPVPDGWGIMAAGNRQGDRGVTYTMPAPLSNRFMHFLFDPSDPVVMPDWVKDYASYCAETRTNPLVSAFIQFCPDALYNAPKPGDVAFPTLRSWSMLARACDRADARNQIVADEIAIGTVGAVQGRSFLAFCQHRAEVPTFAEIVADPVHARCPTTKNLGACFFVVGMLCHHMTGANFAACSKYLARLPAEIDAAAVGMMRHDTRADVLMSRAGQDWLVRIQHLLA